MPSAPAQEGFYTIDHEKNLITVYDFENDNAAHYTFSDDIPVSIYPGFSINLSSLKI